MAQGIFYVILHFLQTTALWDFFQNSDNSSDTALRRVHIKPLKSEPELKVDSLSFQVPFKLTIWC